MDYSLSPPATNEDLPDRVQRGYLHLCTHLQADDPDPPRAREVEKEVRGLDRPTEGIRHGEQGEAMGDLEPKVQERD